MDNIPLQGHFARHTSHIDSPGSKPGLHGPKAATNRLNHSSPFCLSEDYALYLNNPFPSHKEHSWLPLQRQNAVQGNSSHCGNHKDHTVTQYGQNAEYLALNLVVNTSSKRVFFSTGDTTHCGFVFCSPLAGYSFLAYEVS